MDMLQVSKKSGTYADALVAIGIADLVSDIYQSNGFSVQPEILDRGNSYEITLPKPIGANELAQWVIAPGYDYVVFKKPDLMAPTFFFDYEQQREIEKQYRDFLKSIEGGKNRKEVIQQKLQEIGGEIRMPDPKLSLMKTLNSMRMGSNTLGQMHATIREAGEEFKMIVGMKLGYLMPDNKRNHRFDEKPYRSASSTLQLFNPVSGKGINRAKPDGSGLASYPEKLSDWFEEWMKFRAFTKAMLTFNAGSDGKDTKVMVLAPKEVGSEVLTRIHRDLLGKRFYGSVKIDIQSILALTQIIIDHSQEIKGSGVKLARKTPKDIISGFYQAYFKNLGTASAVMNISFLGIPAWFLINDREDAQAWSEIITEHNRCISSLDESHSDNVPILMGYRTFLSTGDCLDALEFFVLYAAHYMRLKSQNKWAEPFTTHNLRRLFMENTNIQEIIQDEGFQAIATAIRKSTVNQQMIKGIKGKADYEIRYGLAQEWKRKVHDKNEFLILLADFAQSYNAENARKIEQKRISRKNITDKDITSVIGLIEKTNNAKLVGLLMLAYGYAKSSKEEDKETIELESEE